MRYFVTGDTHGRFGRIVIFCQENETTQDDVLVICGDAGINYYCDDRDARLKEKLAELPITLFCVHGNHEERPFMLDYETKEWNGGLVYYEEAYPNLLFAKDGEVYHFGDRTVMAIGGAYSVDKWYRLRNGLHWFKSELPTEDMLDFIESQLDASNWKIDIVFTHTVPLAYEPTWAFLPGIDQSAVDKSLENWLQKIVEKLDFEEWYAGHYHVESQEGPIRIMYNDYEELEIEDFPKKEKKKTY